MSVSIEKIVYPGKSLSRDGGKVVFTDEGLPGELIEISILAEKKNLIEAETRAVIERSEARIEPRCAHYKVCSPYQYIDYRVQIEIKKSQVEEIWRQSLKTDPPEIEVVTSPKIWGYRNKGRFKLLRKSGGVTLAYRKPASQTEFVPVDRCFLISDQMNGILASLLSASQAEASETAGGAMLDQVDEIEIRESTATGDLLLILHLTTEPTGGGLKEAIAVLRKDYPLVGAAGIVETERRIRDFRIVGRDFLEERAGGGSFIAGPRSFFQVNVDLLDRVIEDLKDFLALSGDEKIVDLYSGIGTLGIALAPYAREVFGVEADRENISYLKKNLRRNKAGNFSVCEGRSEDWIGDILERYPDVVILDPPRRGIDPGLARMLVERPPGRVAYLSCNPTTLLRDLKALLAGYRLDALRIYDFFPHTPHIETLAMLQRA